MAPKFIKDIGADKVEFKFKRPTSINVGGSYSIQCIVKPDVNVDLYIRLPKVIICIVLILITKSSHVNLSVIVLEKIMLYLCFAGVLS